MNIVSLAQISLFIFVAAFIGLIIFIFTNSTYGNRMSLIGAAIVTILFITFITNSI